MHNLKKLLSRCLRELADKIDAGTSEITETQAMDIVSMLTHIPMSKETACSYMNLSRARFDDYVREGRIPKGRKRVGFKELVWWRDELDECKKK